MTAFILSGFTWGDFLLVFLLASLAWLAWTFKDHMLGKGPPPAAPTSDKKRIWNVSELPLAAENQHSIRVNPFQSAEPDEEQAPSSYDDEFTQMEMMVEQIESIISRSTSDKEEVLKALRPLFFTHATLNIHPFKLAIQNYLSKLALKDLGIALTEQELDELWPAADSTGFLPSA